MNVRRAFEIAIQIADAVADAHAAGFVHGGLSPDSIVISAKGRAKIPAFELASQSGFDKNGRDGAAERLRVAGRGARRGARRSLRHLFGRRHPVRDAHHAATDASRCVGAERVEPQGAERDRRGRAEGTGAECRRAAFRARSRLPASCAARSRCSMRSASPARKRNWRRRTSTSIGRVAAMAGVMLVVAAALAWWFSR